MGCYRQDSLKGKCPIDELGCLLLGKRCILVGDHHSGKRAEVRQIHKGIRLGKDSENYFLFFLDDVLEKG